MDPSPVGILVCALLLLVGGVLGAPLIVATFAALALGSTAVATLSALGGSSPPISVVLLAALMVVTAMKRSTWRELGRILARDPIAWLILALCLYVVIGAMLLPRTFAGLTTAFVPSRSEGRVAEAPLTPVAGNITQSSYFVLSALSYLLFRVLLLSPQAVPGLGRGMLLFAVLHATLGAVDLLAKLAGAGDVLSPIRTANYSMLTDVTEAGLWRIVGGQAEASSFGSLSLACLAFAFTSWRLSRHPAMLLLAAALLTLILLSTSSTAYFGLAILLAYTIASAGLSVVRNRVRLQDLGLLAAAAVALVVFLVISLASDRAFDDVAVLIDKAVTNKASSASAEERFYWNAKSLQAFLDTGGLGIGVGSSRASSWLIAVISQMGIVGVLSFVVLLIVLARGIGKAAAARGDADTRVVAECLRATALAALVGASIGSGAVDPGFMFFAALSVIQHLRWSARLAVDGRTRSSWRERPLELRGSDA